MAAPQQPTCFHSLPPELRNRIYHLAGVAEKYQCQNCTLIRGGTIAPNTTQFPGMDTWCPTCVAAQGQGHASVLGPNAPRFFWVNRSSDRSGPGQSARADQVDCQGAAPGLATASSVSQYVERARQPDAVMVSKRVRNDTLPFYYGNTTFIFTIFGLADRGMICAWLRTIGPENVARLRDVRVVYRAKRDGRWIGKELARGMRDLGVKEEVEDEDGVNEAVVKVERVAAPYCYCEGCVRRAAGVA